MAKQNSADTSKDLKRHICALAADGLHHCIERLSDKPLVVCSRCGAAANSVRNVCATRWDTAPAGRGRTWRRHEHLQVKESL